MPSIRPRQTPSGVRYDVRFRVNGTQRTKTFRTHEDAKAFRRKVEGDDLAGLVTDPKGGERLFGDYADTWVLQRLVKGRPLTPATAQGYRALLRRHLGPTFGATKLRQITRARAPVACGDRGLLEGPGGQGVPAPTGDPQHCCRRRVDRPEPVHHPGRRHRARPGAPDARHGDGARARRGDRAPPALPRPPRWLRRHADRRAARPPAPRRRPAARHGVGGAPGPRASRVLAASHTPETRAGRRTVALPTFVLAALDDHLRDFVAAFRDAFVFTRSTGLPLRRQDLSPPGALPVRPWGSWACGPTTSGTTPPR